MTRARMSELAHRLENEGWKISGEPLEEDLFYVVGEQVNWRLTSPGAKAERFLVFQLCDYLGRRTDELRDVFYVEEKTNHLRLYFEKISAKQWKLSLRDFVRGLY